MKVCIVGNSDNVLGSGKGEFVDSCDRIVRMNNYEIECFEEDVGSREDIVVHALKGEWKKECELWIPKKEADIENAKLPSLELYTELEERCGKEPSTGLVAIAMAIDLFKESDIYLLGFGKTGAKYRHYFSDTWFDSVDDRHNWEEEGRIIEELIEEGKIQYA